MSKVLVDRSRELEVLDNVWASGKPALVVLYGRRRLGKTFLISAWARLRRLTTIYLVVNYSDPEPALHDLEAQLEEQIGLRPRLESLRDLVDLVSRLFCSGRRVIVIDEFQRLAEAGLPQLLQEAWDHRLSSCGDSMLLLLGSSVGAVERVALAGGAPLYGRAVRILRLRPMSFTEAYPFIADAPSSEESFTLYAVFGGTPYYLSLLEPREGLERNLERLVFSPGAPLLEEPLQVLMAEVREPSRYNAILEAVARGASRVSEIAGATGLQATSLPRYLRVLESMDLVCHVRMVKGSRGFYRVCDNFFRFWYRHVSPQRRLIELGLYRQVLGKVLRDIVWTVSEAWEMEASRHFLQQLEAAGEPVEAAGPWVYKDVEIDYVVVAGDKLYGVEAKWSKLTSPDLARVAARLEAKLERLPWARKGAKPVPVIYARKVSGNPPPGAIVYSLEDIVEEAKKTPAYPIPA